MDTGLNVFQVIQNELLSREGTRSTIGLGARLIVLEERLKNNEAVAKNGLAWKLHHAAHAISAVTPDARSKIEKERERLLSRRGANKEKDEKDPTMLPRHQEAWEIHKHFPRTILEFKQLQFHRKSLLKLFRSELRVTALIAERIRSLMEFYGVRAYRPDMRLVSLDPDNRCRDIELNLEVCLEELAISWGLNYFKIGGLSLPPPNGNLPHPPNAPTPPRYSPSTTATSYPVP